MAHYNRHSDALVSRIIALAEGGMQPALIAREIANEASLSVIYVILARARKSGRNIPRFPAHRIKGEGTSIIHVCIRDQQHRDYLTAAARSRRTSRQRIVDLIVTTALHEKMIDSILDDGGVTDG